MKIVVVGGSGRVGTNVVGQRPQQVTPALKFCSV